MNCSATGQSPLLEVRGLGRCRPSTIAAIDFAPPRFGSTSARSNRAHYFPATMGFRRMPTFSSSISTTSPGWIAAVFPGVPV